MTSFRNFAGWEYKLFPPWKFHLENNPIIDSDLYLLHLQFLLKEHKLREKGLHNWQKVCYVPTKADALVVGFRRWLIKYEGAQVDWGTKFTGDLQPTPSREQLLDTCSKAYKSLNALEIILQIISIASSGIAAVAKESVMSIVARYSLVFLALLCFMASRWLSKFIQKFSFP
ncbi:protochlorophyllide-dependent translocon component 52, chloroplastic-like [Solanum pennellii]|uniref:Protochlorophyllide-dependent translocon component 52, chloroplastic-like n=1 Tax=Solanum pennellii TaxID=28526 RepID=A0ABM1GKR5_SOLPN|nr:protochlorophyllide-dependent translocon component 52, chloroplastic-like [Solanum pennellii]